MIILKDNDSLKQTVIETINTVSNMDPDTVASKVKEMLIYLGIKIVAVIALFIIGRWLIRRLKLLIESRCRKRKFDPSVSGFLASFVNVSLTVLLWVAIIGVLGVPTSTFAALIAAGGLSIGMALSGTLQNFAGGVIILVFKPFKVGDDIETSSLTGTVKTIKVTYTEIQTFDNVIVAVPNGSLLTVNVSNYSSNATRRVKWTVSLEYGDDVEKARELILGYLAEDSRILETPAPSVVLSSLAASSIDLTVFGWTEKANYWKVFWEINEKIYSELPKGGLHFPYPKLDVNLVSNQPQK